MALFLNILHALIFSVATYFSFIYLNSTGMSIWLNIPVSLIVGKIFASTFFFAVGIILGVLGYMKIINLEKLKEQLYNIKESVENLKDETEEEQEEQEELSMDISPTSPTIFSKNVVGTFMDSPIYEWVKLKNQGPKFVYESVLQKNVDGNYNLPYNTPEVFIILEPGVMYVPENSTK